MEQDCLPPELDWAETYSQLGLGEAFTSLLKRLNFSLLRNLSAVLVLPEVDTSRLGQAYVEAGLGLISGPYCLVGDRVRHARWPTSSPYLVCLQRDRRPDRQHLGRSALHLEGIGVRGINLIEYLLFFLALFLTAGQYLDTETCTLCSGTSAEGYLFPSVYFDVEKNSVAVSWVDVSYADPRLGVRQVALSG